MSQPVAIVVGATGVLGRGMVTTLLNQNCRVAAVARGLSRLESLTRDDDSLSIHVADFTQFQDITRCIREVTDTHNQIDYVIYTPSLPPQADVPLLEVTLSDWQAHFDIHVTGFFLCFKHIANVIERGGHIAVISSAITRFRADQLPPNIYAGQYAAAKAALDEFCKWARREAHEKGFMLSHVAPGAIDCPYHRDAPAYRRPPALLPPSEVATVVVNALLTGREIDEVLVAKQI